LPAMIAYSLAVHEVVKLGAQELWKHNHRKLARVLVGGDVIGDGFTGFYNYRLVGNWGAVSTPASSSGKIEPIHHGRLN
jgi:hypothetical protein